MNIRIFPEAIRNEDVFLRLVDGRWEFTPRRFIEGVNLVASTEVGDTLSPILFIGNNGCIYRHRGVKPPFQKDGWNRVLILG